MKKPILVTGSHRSGSTWVGQIISEAPKVGYVHEPFNCQIVRFNQPFRHMLEHVSEKTDPSQQAKVEKYMHSFCGFPNGVAFSRIFTSRSLKDIYFTIWDLGDFNRRFAQRTLFKDPIAIFSAEWLYKHLDCDVVVVIRHPAAFVASLVMKEWRYEFKNLIDQPDLLNTHLSDFKEEIEEQYRNPKDIVEQGILLWNMIHHMISYYKKKYENEWVFVRHEDLSINPMEEFKSIYLKLNLEFTEKVKRKILESTTSNVESDHKRDAVKNIKTWQKRLSEEQIAQIKEGTKKVYPMYYSEEDWE